MRSEFRYCRHILEVSLLTRFFECKRFPSEPLFESPDEDAVHELSLVIDLVGEFCADAVTRRIAGDTGGLGS